MIRILFVMFFLVHILFFPPRANATEDASFTFDLKNLYATTFPLWVQPAEMISGSLSSHLDLTIHPHPGWAGLSVTIVFEEPQDGQLKCLWFSNRHNQIVSENVFEGTSAPNQRTLLIPRELLSDSGTLRFMISGDLRPLKRIRLTPLKWKTMAFNLSSEEYQIINETGRPIKSNELSGDNIPLLEDIWDQNVFSAVLLDAPRKIQENVSFEFELSAIPLLARLGGKVSGSTFNERFHLWINHHYAGDVQALFPSLNDPGYLIEEDKTTFFGWGEISFHLPPPLLKEGLNTLTIVASKEGSSYSLKETQIQLYYPQKKPSFSVENNPTPKGQREEKTGQEMIYHENTPLPLP